MGVECGEIGVYVSPPPPTPTPYQAHCSHVLPRRRLLVRWKLTQHALQPAEVGARDQGSLLDNFDPGWTRVASGMLAGTMFTCRPIERAIAVVGMQDRAMAPCKRKRGV